MINDKEIKFVITTYNGLESILARELTAMGALKVKAGNREVTCIGDVGFMYKVNFALRTALSVRIEVKRFKYKNVIELYESVNEINWTNYINADETFCVNLNSDYDLSVTNANVITDLEKVITEQFITLNSAPPSVEKNNPALEIAIEIYDDKCRIIINTSGESLAERGYINSNNADQLDNVMAVGLVLLSGWEPHTPLVDFVCGSAVIPIEAALYAAKIPPGTFRKQFAFERWKNFNAELFEVIRDKQLSRIADNPVRIFASDSDPDVVENAKQNIIAAGVDDMITVSCCELKDVDRPAANGTIILSPAINKIENTDAIEFYYAEIGKCLKNNFTGYKTWLCTDGNPYAGRIGLRYSHKIELDHQTNYCWFFKYNLFADEKKG